MLSLDFLLKFSLKPVKTWLRTLCFFIALGCVVALRFLVSFAQDSDLPKHLKPGIGEDYCWFDGAYKSLKILLYIKHISYLYSLQRKKSSKNPPEILYYVFSSALKQDLLSCSAFYRILYSSDRLYRT